MTPSDILSKGFVFPLSAATRKPIIKWRDGSQKGSSAFPNHKGPWGLDCGKSRLVVVDVDHKDGKANGLANLHLLGPLPETYTVRTRSGGLHIYFHNPQGNPEVANSASKLAPHIDVRGDGGYVVIYDDVVCDAKIAKLPDDLRQAMGTVEPRSDLDIMALIDLDQPKNIHAAIEYLRSSAPIAAEGEAGDLTTLKVALRLKDLGLSPEAALEAMLSDWNDRCDPPWDVDKLERKVRNAYEYGRNAPGSATREHTLLASEIAAAEAFEGIAAQTPPPPEPEHVEEPERGPRPASSFAYGQAPVREWLIEGWIPLKSVTSTYGCPGIGKSLIAVETGMCLSNGVPWYGIPIKQAYPVLYVSCEDDDAELHHRIDAVRHKEAHQPFAGNEHNFHIWDRVGKESLLAVVSQAGARRQKFLGQLEDQLADLAPKGDHRVLILDTVTDMGKLNENDRMEVNLFVKSVLGGLCMKYNATVIFLAHPSKGGDYSGSTNWQGSVRAQLFLKWHEDDLDLRWLSKNKTNRAQRDNGEGAGILLRWINGAFVEQDVDQFERDLKASQKRAIFNYLAQNEGIKVAHQARNPLKNHQIFDENGCQIKADRVKLLVSEMLSDGTLREDERLGLMAENFIPMEEI